MDKYTDPIRVLRVSFKEVKMAKLELFQLKSRKQYLVFVPDPDSDEIEKQLNLGLKLKTSVIAVKGIDKVQVYEILNEKERGVGQ